MLCNKTSAQLFSLCLQGLDGRQQQMHNKRMLLNLVQEADRYETNVMKWLLDIHERRTIYLSIQCTHSHVAAY